MLFRCTFSIINIIFFALGLAIVICSWLLHLKSTDYGPLVGNQWFTAPVILIFSAKLSMVLGIVGCLGAWFEKKALLFLYIIIMVLIFIGLLVGVVLIIALSERMSETARQNLLTNIRQYPNERNHFRERVNRIQSRLHCCGIDDYQDYFNADIWSEQSFIPDSCCIEPKHDCARSVRGNETLGLIYTDGCFNRIQMEINRNLMIVGILAFALVFVEGFCIVAALGLLCYLRQRDSYI